MDLFGVPPVMLMVRSASVLAGGLIELLVFLGAEPGAMRDLSLRPLGRGKIGELRQPAVPDACLEHLPESDDLIVDRPPGRKLACR